MNSKLSERKLKILQFIVEEYISTAEPVGSRTISKNKELAISAATVRNEMSDLEEMGFLVQPHVSAGRVPSPLAYSLYVEELMKGRNPDDRSKRIIEEVLDSNINQINSLLNETAKLLSDMTNYTSIAVVTNSQKQTNVVSHFELIKLGENQIVMIMVMEDGKVHSKNLYIDRQVDKEKLDIISSALRDQIVGKDLSSLGAGFINYIESEIIHYDRVLTDMLDSIKNSISSDTPFNVVLKGTKNIFNYPEFNDIDVAKSFLSLLDNKNELVKLISGKGLEKDNVNIIIGDESMGQLLDNCSIITANFESRGKNIGTFGIIGPKRMDYEKAYSLMRYITKYLNELF